MTELHLQMGEEEILQEYKYATKKFDQVRILAELNCVSKKDMEGLSNDSENIPAADICD